MDAKPAITKDMIMGDILRQYPAAAYPLMECGMGCIGCPASQGESLEQAAMVHGLDVDEVIRHVNSRLAEQA